MQSVQTTSQPVAVLEDSELLSCVIDKHKKFIEEYGSELEQLLKTIEEKRSAYQQINNELETLETRIVVLNEKRHQLYHQAHKLRIQFLDSFKDRTQIRHLEKEIENIENRLQYANVSMNDEFGHVDHMISVLKEIASTVPQLEETQQRTISSIFDILETAKAAREELNDIQGAPEKFKDESRTVKTEFEDMDARIGWLKRRLDLHRAALEYWEKVNSGALDNE